jgi:hypothetical protein
METLRWFLGMTSSSQPVGVDASMDSSEVPLVESSNLEQEIRRRIDLVTEKLRKSVPSDAVLAYSKADYAGRLPRRVFVYLMCISYCSVFWLICSPTIHAL